CSLVAFLSHSTSTLLLHVFCFFNSPAPPAIYTLSLHDALPISEDWFATSGIPFDDPAAARARLIDLLPGWHPRFTALIEACDDRSEEHTSELQSRFDLVCRLLLEKKKK